MIAALAILSWLHATIPLSPQKAETPAATPDRIEWQRSLADALAVQKETGLPLLVVVNMDGEVFNENFAGTTYHDPKFVESTRGYVCVVASPDRHNERDYDALGRRIECPRFPGCTCSEHRNIEPELFRRYFNGKRNAPRHVGVAPDEKILFDRYLDQSMQTAIDAIARHRGTPPSTLGPTSNFDELMRRRDALARRTLEASYRDGDTGQKRKILELLPDAKNEPVDLLRMVLREEDGRLHDFAARTLARTAGRESLIDLEDALARAEDEAVVAALLERVRTLGAEDKSAAQLATHFDLGATEELPQPWSRPWQRTPFDPESREAIEAALDRAEADLKNLPGDDATRLQLATAQAALADWLARTGGKGAEFWWEDAMRTAMRIAKEELQAEAQAIVAIAAWQRSDAAAAHASAVRALSIARSEREPDTWLAAKLLGVVVQTTAQVAYGKAKADVTASLRAEIVRVHAVLQLLETRGQIQASTHLAGIALLEFGRLRQLAERHLKRLAMAMPTDPAVHERWRARLLVDLGAEGMRSRYAGFVADTADKPAAMWFAGYAALAAGEQHTRDQRPAAAISAYGEAIERFAASAKGNEDFADSAHHFMVLALGGRALLLQTAGDGDGAIADLLHAAALRPASLDEQDGLERKPRAIAGRIARELRESGKAALAERLGGILQ